MLSGFGLIFLLTSPEVPQETFTVKGNLKKLSRVKISFTLEITDKTSVKR